MATLHPNKRHLLLAALLFGNSSAQTLQLPDPAQPITITANSSVLDHRQNTVLYRKVRIAQGDVSVEANEANATGHDFENSRWTFTGDVRIRLPDGKIDADSAVVTFNAGQLAHARMAGSPAQFEQHRTDPEQLARGHAGTIEYDITHSTVRLSDKAWLSDGTNEISSETLVYDMRGERVLANPDGKDQGVNITFRPKAAGGTPFPVAPKKEKKEKAE
jgi:lipopolysaccharide transport protein LptA